MLPYTKIEYTTEIQRNKSGENGNISTRFLHSRENKIRNNVSGGQLVVGEEQHGDEKFDILELANEL